LTLHTLFNALCWLETSQNINPNPSQMSLNNSPMLVTVLTIQTSPNFIIWVGFVSNNPLNKDI